jgi:hypothetical protein
MTHEELMRLVNSAWGWLPDKKAALSTALTEVLAERDALRTVVQAALDNLNPGYVVASASRIHKDMQAAMKGQQ